MRLSMNNSIQYLFTTKNVFCFRSKLQSLLDPAQDNPHGEACRYRFQPHWSIMSLGWLRSAAATKWHPPFGKVWYRAATSSPKNRFLHGRNQPYDAWMTGYLQISLWSLRVSEIRWANNRLCVFLKFFFRSIPNLKHEESLETTVSAANVVSTLPQQSPDPPSTIN